MSAKYEATSPITLTAGETKSGVQDLLCVIDAAGEAVVATAGAEDVMPVGTFAQDEITDGEPVTVNQLMGKVRMVPAVAVTRGHVALIEADPGNGNVNAGKIEGVANDSSAWAANLLVLGVILQSAAANVPVQVLAMPIGKTK